MLAAIETKRCDSQASDQALNQGCHQAGVAVPARLGSQLERPLVAAKLLEGEEAELWHRSSPRMQVPRTRPGDMHEQRALNAPDLLVVVLQGALPRQDDLLQVLLGL